MRLLIANVLKGVKKRLFQYFGIVILLVIALSSINALFANSQRVSSAFYEVADNSGAYDYRINFNNISAYKDPQTALTKFITTVSKYFSAEPKKPNSDIETFLNKNLSLEQFVVNQLPSNIEQQPSLEKYFLNWNMDYRAILLNNILNQAFNQNQANGNYQIQESYFKGFDHQDKTNNLFYSFEDAFINNKPDDLPPANWHSTKFNYDPFRDGFNKIYITDGVAPNPNDSDFLNEVVINPVFAKHNNLSIGSTLKVNFNNKKNYNLKIVGFGYSYWGVTGNRSVENINPTPENTTPIFTTQDWMQDYFLSSINNMQPLPQQQLFLKVANNDNFFASRVKEVLNQTFVFSYATLITADSDDLQGGALKQQFSMTNIVFISISFIVVVVIIFIVLSYVRKEIELQKKQIGVIKALGYSNREISFSYTILFFLITLVSGIIGFIVSLPLQLLFNSLSVGDFFLPIPFLYISILTSILSVIVIPIIFGVASYLQSWLKLNISSLILIYDLPSNSATNVVAFFKKPFSYWSFKPRLAISFALKSFGKLILIFLTFAFVSFLLLFETVASDVFNNKIDNLYGFVNSQVYSSNGTINMFGMNKPGVNNEIYQWSTFGEAKKTQITAETFRMDSEQKWDDFQTLEANILINGVKGYWIASQDINFLHSKNINDLTAYIYDNGVSGMSESDAATLANKIIGFLNIYSEYIGNIPGASVQNLPGLSVAQNLITNQQFPDLQFFGSSAPQWIGHNQGKQVAKDIGLTTLYNYDNNGLNLQWKEWFNLKTAKNRDADWIFNSSHSLVKQDVSYIDNFGKKENGVAYVIPSAISQTLAQLNGYKYGSQFLSLFNINNSFVPIIFDIKAIVVSNLDTSALYTNIDDIRTAIGYVNSDGTPITKTFNHVYSKQDTILNNNMIALASSKDDYNVSTFQKSMTLVNKSPVIYSLLKATFAKLFNSVQSILAIIRWLIVFALLFVLIIIINMILDNNISIIAMMKSLGYRINEINLLIMGTYIVGLIFAYVIGTILAYGAWSIIVYFVGKLATTVLLVPISPFTIFTTFALIFSVLIIGYIISLIVIKKKPVTILLQG